MPDRNPIVSVVSIAHDGVPRDSTDHLLATSIKYMDSAAGAKSDIVCLPETSFQSKPDQAPEIIERLGKWASEHNSYVIASMLTADGDLTFKSAILLDRAGKQVGRYDKIHLTEGEVDEALCPGKTDPPVFKTDFGTIGIQICFDCNWPETWARIAEKGAKLVFFCSAFPAHTHMSAYCWQNEYFIVSSTKSRPSRIYDISGRVIDQSGSFRPWVHADIPLGKRLLELDFHVDKLRQIELKYGPRVVVEWVHDSDWATITSVDPDLPTEDIIKQFELTPLVDYRIRAKKYHDAARKKLLGE